MDKVWQIKPRKTMLGIQDITINDIEYLNKVAETSYYSQIEDRKQSDKVFILANERDSAVEGANRLRITLAEEKSNNRNLQKVKRAFERLPEK